MRARTRFLGHLDIDPPLNQAEYDHLRAVARGEIQLVVGDDEPRPWFPWEPCPHGCCLEWDGSDCYGPADRGLQLLVDHYLSPDTPVVFDDAHLEGFTSDRDVNGVVVAEDDDDRRLWLVRVTHGRVEVDVLNRGDPSPILADGTLRELPWLSPEPSRSERYRRENEALLAKLGQGATLAGRKMGGRASCTRRSPKAGGS